MTKITREEWLQKAMHKIYNEVFKPKGIKVDIKNIQVACSFVIGSRNSQYKTHGDCWTKESSTGGFNEIHIVPTVDDPITVLDILTHEMVHASDNCGSGHGKIFKQRCLLIGMNGSKSMKTACAGEPLLLKFDAMVKELGEYPHKAMDIEGRKKQTTRNKKIYCRSCGWSFRTSGLNIAKMFEHDLTPDCLACSGGTLREV